MEWIDRATAGHPEARFADGEVLIGEGEETTPLLVLLEGTVSIYRGTVCVNRISDAGAFFGEMSALLGSPSSASVIADGPVRAIRIESALAFLGSEPEIALHTARLLAQRLNDATAYLADLKKQFEGETSHLGMVDRILSSLLNQQVDTTARIDVERQDSRL